MDLKKEKEEISLLSRAGGILNSLASMVFLTYMLDVLFDSNFVQNLGIFGLLIFIPLKILLFTAMFVTLIEIASGEEILFQFARFKSNVTKFWKIYALALCLPLAIYFIVKYVFRLPQNLSISVLMFHLNIVIFFLVSYGIINAKYIKPGALKRRSIVLSLKSVGIILALYGLDLAIFYLPQYVDTSRFYLPNLLGFLARYLDFFIFTYLSLIIFKQYPEIEKRFTFDRELYLINPYPYGGDLLTGFSYSAWRWHPPIFVVLRALTPKHYKVTEFNQRIWANRYYKKNALVAITCYTSNSPEAYRIAKEFKRRGATVIMGGPHIMCVPQEAIDYCDSVVVGDVEGVWREIIRDYENGSLKKEYSGESKKEDHEFVQQELMTSTPEVVKDFLEPTRGCKFKCHFCAIPGIVDNIKRLPVEEFLSLIKRIKHRYNRDLYFIDSNIYSDPAYSKELFQALKPMNVTWQSAATIDIAKNQETLKLARESGCKLLLCGYEVPAGSLETKVDGKLTMADRYIDYTRIIQKTGIKIKGTFMFGWESDSYKSLFELWKFCFKLSPQITVMSILTPIPGSKLYVDMLKSNRLTNLNWRAYAFYSLVYKHPNLDNFIFPKLFIFIRYVFFFTTSTFGRKVFIFVLIGVALLLLTRL